MATTDGTLAVANQQAMGVSEEATQLLNTFWQRTADDIKNMSADEFRSHELPLARIKKIMKLDEDVKMISAEAPVLFAKAAEIFISELSLRSWIHTEDNKRRTLQRNDISMAIAKYDQFDFLIDIVPREELKAPVKRPDESGRSSSIVDQVQLYVQMAQQAASGITTQATTGNIQTITQTPQQVIQQPATQIIQQVPQTVSHLQGQVIQQQPTQQPFQIQTVQTPVTTQQQPQPTQLIQVQSLPQGNIQTVAQPATQNSTQVYQQVITPTGEIQNVPIQLTGAQLQALQLQIQGKNVGQQIVIQHDQDDVAQTTDQQQQNDHFTTSQQPQQQRVYQIQQVPVSGQQVFIQEAAEPDSTHETPTT